MKKKLLAVLFVAVGLIVLSGPLFAHHATAMYDLENPVTVTGTVTELRFTNPHVLILFEVEEADGTVVKWAAGTAPPQRMYRAGWNAKTLQPGDKITVTGGPRKDGEKEMVLMKLVGPTGKVLSGGDE